MSDNQRKDTVPPTGWWYNNKIRKVNVVLKLMRFMGLCFGCALVFSGCSSLPVLTEPDPVPACVPTYKDSGLEGFSNVVVDFDFSDCVQGAMLVSKGVFGGVAVEAAYPVRNVVEREFLRMASDNFAVSTNNSPVDIVVHVSTMRMLLIRTQSTYSSDLSLTIKVFNSASDKSASIFRKTYRAKSTGSVEDDDEIPQCFYEAVQSIVSEFVTDISANRNLIRFFESRKNKGE